MYKIGIIGTENSHALALSKLFNIPGEDGKLRHPGYRVTGVFGPDLEPAQKVIDEGKAEYIADNFTDMIGKVDAMIVTSRRGSVHHKYAAPFIDKGIPVFVDKPFTSDPAEAEDLIARAEKSGCLLWGGSSFKTAYDTMMMRHSVAELRKKGTFRGGSMNYAVVTDSEYDGFYFYAPHLTESCLMIFGGDLRAVRAFAKEKNVTVIARYDEADVSLHYTQGTWQATCTAFGSEGNVTRNIDGALSFGVLTDMLVQMIESKKAPEPYKNLVQPVYVMKAILDSLEQDKEIAL
jgi:predicted dehydrogenase